MDLTLLKLLEETGFTEKEAQVYLALLELGEGDVGDISRISDLKRPIIYVILEGLIKRGYATQVPNRKVNTFQAGDPVAILSSLKITTKHFSEMLPIFQTLSNKSGRRPKIQYYETVEGIWKANEEMFAAKEVFVITSHARVEKYFPNSVREWVKDYKKGVHKMRGWHLIPDDPDELEYGLLMTEADQEVKKLKALQGLSIDIVLYGDKLAITSYDEKPFMFVIESETIAKSVMLLFKIAWARGVDIKKKKPAGPGKTRYV